MIQYASGTINRYISVAANPMYPAYVVKGTSKSLMIDAGINLFGPLYLSSLDEILGGRHRLDYLFLTHSHYDHLGSAPYLRRNLPDLKIGAHERIASLMKRESVIEMMRGLSENHRLLFNEIAGEEDVSLQPLELDLALQEGDRIDLGGLTCEVYEVPGHTRDSLAFYVPEIDALFPGEAAGVPEDRDGNGVQVEFLSSYDDYLSSLKKMIAMKPRLLAIGHGFVFTDDDADGFLERSFDATAPYRQLIADCLAGTGGDIDRAIAEIARKEYDQKGTIMQERNAYLQNLSAQVRHIAGMNG